MTSKSSTITRRALKESRRSFEPMADGMPPIHPGEIILEDVIRPLGMSVHAFAQALRVPATRMSEIVHGRRSVTADTALRLAQYLGTTARIWIDLQATFDLKIAEAAKGKTIRREIRPRAA